MCRSQWTYSASQRITEQKGAYPGERSPVLCLLIDHWDMVAMCVCVMSCEDLMTVVCNAASEPHQDVTEEDYFNNSICERTAAGSGADSLSSLSLERQRSYTLCLVIW